MKQYVSRSPQEYGRTEGNRVFDLNKKFTPQQLLPQFFQVGAAQSVRNLGKASISKWKENRQAPNNYRKKYINIETGNYKHETTMVMSIFRYTAMAKITPITVDVQKIAIVRCQQEDLCVLNHFPHKLKHRYGPWRNLVKRNPLDRAKAWRFPKNRSPRVSVPTAIFCKKFSLVHSLRSVLTKIDVE